MVRTVDIGCHQVLMQDASVWSVQTLAIPPAHVGSVTPAALFHLYLEHISRYTLGLVKPLFRDGGLHFSLAGSRLSLICFSPPEETHERICIKICGGILVQRDNCHRGELTFAVSPAPDGASVASLTLADYCPLLLGSLQPSRTRKWLYRFTQAAIHKMVTIHFLARVYRRLCDPDACIRVVRSTPLEGENI
jgi:hypothetical protein